MTAPTTRKRAPRQRVMTQQKPGLRAAINAKCRECIHDPADAGSAAQQIACCTITDCPLHPVRPITATTIPMRLLDGWCIHPAELCERARPLVETSPGIAVDGQNGPQAGGKAENGMTLHGDGAGGRK